LDGGAKQAEHVDFQRAKFPNVVKKKLLMPNPSGKKKKKSVSASGKRGVRSGKGETFSSATFGKKNL